MFVNSIKDDITESEKLIIKQKEGILGRIIETERKITNMNENLASRIHVLEQGKADSDGIIHANRKVIESINANIQTVFLRTKEVDNI